MAKLGEANVTHVSFNCLEVDGGNTPTMSYTMVPNKAMAKAEKDW